jgi:sec-independent protein translocase protein TatC
MNDTINSDDSSTTGKSSSNPEGKKIGLKDMPIISHLEELRTRIIISLVAFMVAIIITWNFRDYFMLVALFPYPEGFKPVVLDVTERFINYFKVSVVAALILSSPIIMWQLWSFISPALLPKEKRYIVPAVPVIVFLFLTGAAFGYFVLLRFALAFLLNFGSDEIINQIRLDRAISFVTTICLACGAIFQLPVIAFLLSKIGLVSPSFLRKKRKIAILVIFILAAVITPTPDPFNMTLMALPMILLYEISIYVSAISFPKESRISE